MKYNLELVILVSVLVTSCGQSSGPHKPTSAGGFRRPDTATITFADVQPIFMSRCTPCHTYASDYEAARSLAESGTTSLMYKYVIEGEPREMPPPGSPQSVSMSEEERLTVGEWVLAGARTEPGVSPDGDMNGEMGDLSRAAVLSFGGLVARSQSCHSCHSEFSGVPGASDLGGLSATYIEQQLFDYRSGKRESLTMQPVAQSMTTDEIQAVALWYEQVDDEE